MKSSPKMKVAVVTMAKKRTRHVPAYTYFAQIFSGDLNQRLFELLSFDAFSEEESKKCEAGKTILVWPVSIDQVKTLYLSQSRSHFDIWQSKDEDTLVKVTIPLQKKLFKQKVSRGARMKKGSEIKQPKMVAKHSDNSPSWK